MKCVLLVGEGDFSFTVAFLQQNSGRFEVTTTSLLSEEEVNALHKNAAENIKKITHMGGKVLFGVDATALHINRDLMLEDKFDIIMFNFPHTGGKSNIKKNRQLLKSFFISAVQVLAKDGQVKVTLACGQGGTPADKPMREWQNSWQIVAMAAYANLILHGTEGFTSSNFPEYSSSGFRSQDKYFHTEGGIVHVFERSFMDLPGPDPDDMRSLSIQSSETHLFGRYITDKIRRIDDALRHEPCHPFNIINTRIQEIARKVFNRDIRQNGSLPRTLNKCGPSVPHYQGFPGKIWSKNGHMYTTSDECETAYLRSTLLQNELYPDNIEDDIPLWYEGDVYRPCVINEMTSPVDVEVVAINRNGDCQNFEAKTRSVLGELLSGNSMRILSGEDVTMLYHSEWLDIKWVMTLPTASPNVETDVNAGNTLAIFGCRKSERKTSVLLLSIISIAKVLYKVTDHRIFWTRDPRYFTQYVDKPACLNSCPYSIFPPSWTFDLSFWKSDIFDEQIFFNICRDYCGDSILSVRLVDTYHDENSSRVSHCYRLVFQSCGKALSYSTAHDLQKCLRLEVSRCLLVELR